MAPRSRLGLSFYEILYGRPFLLSFHELGVPMMLLFGKWSIFGKYSVIEVCFPQADVPQRCALIPPGSWRSGVIKDLESKHREDQLHPHWIGPYEVLALTTHSSAQLEGSKPSIHHTHIQLVSQESTGSPHLSARENQKEQTLLRPVSLWWTWNHYLESWSKEINQKVTNNLWPI